MAYHIGGNDFVQNIAAITFMSFTFPKYLAIASNNNERIVTLFYQKGKNVLLTGHYPAIANSIDGSIKESEFSNFKGYDKPVDVNLKDRLRNGCRGIEALDRTAVSKYGKAFLDNWEGVKGPGTYASAGLLQLEMRIEEMKQRRQRYFSQRGLFLDHLPVWRCFQREDTDEPWIIHSELASDLIHPNATGFALWGELVGDRMRQLGWPASNFSILNQSVPTPPSDNGGEEIKPEPGFTENELLLLILLWYGIHR